MLVIIEGADGAGKTTLASALVAMATADRVVPWIIHKSQPAEDEDLRLTYVNDLEFYEPNIIHSHLVVCDRWHLGEMIYGPIYRGRSQLQDQDVLKIDRLIDKKGGVRLFLDAPDRRLIYRAFTRGESFVQTPRDLIQIAIQYRELAMEYEWRLRTNDEVSTTIDVIARDVYRHAKHLESEAAMAE